MYFNLYQSERVFGAGCGMPDKEYLWSPHTECMDTSAVGKTFRTLREIAMSKASPAIERIPKFTDDFTSAYAFITTLACSAEFLRANRERVHGIDWMETMLWLHQLSEYSLDVDLDNLVSRRYWNHRRQINDTCVP